MGAGDLLDGIGLLQRQPGMGQDGLADGVISTERLVRSKMVTPRVRPPAS